MEELQFKRVTKDVEYGKFDCGVPSINEDVEHSYYSHILQHAYAYSIVGRGKTLGYFQIMFRDVEIKDFPEDISEYEPEVKDRTITAVHIRFIAVDKAYQHKGIGQSVLETIIMRVNELSEKWPIRIITIDARCDLVDWYTKCGFKPMIHNKEGQNGVTIAMYLDCIRYGEEFSEYIENMCM